MYEWQTISVLTNEIKGHHVIEKMRLRSYDNTYEYVQRTMMIYAYDLRPRGHDNTYESDKNINFRNSMFLSLNLYFVS